MDQNQAKQLISQISGEYNIPCPTLQISNSIPEGYLGMFNEESWSITVRPNNVNTKIIRHELGHCIYHSYNPGVCKGVGSRYYGECEGWAVAFELDQTNLLSLGLSAGIVFGSLMILFSEITV